MKVQTAKVLLSGGLRALCVQKLPERHKSRKSSKTQKS